MEKGELKNFLREYKYISDNIIEALTTESFDSLEGLFMERQQIIQTIEKLSFFKEEFKAISVEFSLEEIERDIENLINDKKAKIRLIVENLNKSKRANTTYNKNSQVDSLYFNKKI